MADPKYAGLPGIATDQPDMFETFSDGDTDPEDESESEQSESLHMSSLSCVGGDLEIVQPGATETLMQKFTRLHCEVNEFSEDLNSMTESVRDGSISGLHLQVDRLREELERFSVAGDQAAGEQDLNQDPTCDISSQAKQLHLLEQQIIDLEKGDPKAVALKYDLYIRKTNPAPADSISRLDQRLARLEQIVGTQQQVSNKVLSVRTDNLALIDAVKYLTSKKHNLATDHLTHIEGRLSALTTKLNSLKEQKERLNTAKSASQVARIFSSMEANVGLMTVIPEVEARLEDVAGLNKQAQQWNLRLSEVSSDQEKTETLLVDNSKRLEATQARLGESLHTVTDKLEKLQADLLTIKS